MDFFILMAFCAVFAFIALRLHAKRRGPKMTERRKPEATLRKEFIRRPARKEPTELKVGNR